LELSIGCEYSNDIISNWLCLGEKRQILQNKLS